MSTEFIPFSVDTSRVLELLAKQIYQSPLALLRENTQNAFDATLLRKHKDVTFIPKIEIEITPLKVIVKDNGIGMTPEDLKQHFWQAGSSSKNTDEARLAGVVGTFGIGAMANFGIADELEVTTESAITGERTKCIAKRTELKFNQDCIASYTLESMGIPGTEIVAHITPNNSLDVSSVIAYVSDFVSLLETPVIVNGESVSGKSIDSLISSVTPVWSNTIEAAVVSPRLTADVTTKISINADISFNISRIKWNDTPLHGRLFLKSGTSTIKTYRSGFGLATVSVGSAYQLGGIADIQAFQPTAGREALTTASMQLLQSLITDIDFYASMLLSKRPEADSSTAFINWISSHNRFDLGGKLKISRTPGERISLEDIAEITKNHILPVYDGSDQTIISSYSTEDKPLLLLARNNPRKKCEQQYLHMYCKTEIVSNTPIVNKIIKESELKPAEAALSFRLQSILEGDYFVSSQIVYGKISHGLVMLVNTEGDITKIFLDPEGQTVATILHVYDHEYSAFGSIVKDFVRNAIFPKIADKVPSSTRQGAEAFLKSIRRPREVFEYEDSDTSSLSFIWNDYADGKISLDEAVERSQAAVRNSVQIVDSNNAARVSDVIPDVIPNEQTTTQITEEEEVQILSALPAITRIDVTSNAKLLTIPKDQPALRGYRCFIALTEKVRADMGDFFLQPHKTSIVWGGQKVLFIFLHHSGEFGLYYDLQTRDSISDHSGGKSYQTSTMIIKNMIYIPVPEEIERSFVPIQGEKKRFEVKCDLLRVDAR